MPEQGRLKIALDRFIAATLPQIDYAAQYPGTIVAQSGQTFDFDPDSIKLPGIQGVGIYAGMPGITFTVNVALKPRAVLFFAGNSPAGAALGLWGNPGLQSLSIGPNATLAAARATDPVQVGPLMATWMAAVVTACGSNTPPITIPTPPTLLGTIQTGSTITTIA